MKRVIFAALALLGSVGTINAQSGLYSERSDAEGILMNNDIMSIAEMGSLSRTSFQYGTARSMAMAGAMTSLGADASSMMINPAGLGMYRSGEISFTPMLNLQRSDVSGMRPNYDDKVNSTTISNFSAIFNLYENPRTKLITINAGFGYNKIADFNYQYSMSELSQKGSIADLYSEQLTFSGVSVDKLYGDKNPNWNSLSSYLWGAALGYKNGLTDQTDLIDGDPIWSASWISPDASIDHFLSVESAGSIGEYDFSLGANVDNRLYLGFTLGVQNVYQRLDLIYSELYNDNKLPSGNYLEYTNYNQTAITSGVGVNLKLGATYRPTQAFRLGFAYHSPTWYQLEREYQGSMGSATVVDGESDFGIVDSPILKDLNDNAWRFDSPSRILVGGSYTIGYSAIISVDYQRDWYSNIKTRSLPYGVEAAMYDDIRSALQSVNTLKIGMEYMLSPQFALRGGYGVSSSMVSDDAASAVSMIDKPTANKIEYFACGVGFAPARGVSFDLTYMRHATHLSGATLFNGLGEYTHGGEFFTKIYENNIALSLVLKL